MEFDDDMTWSGQKFMHKKYLASEIRSHDEYNACIHTDLLDSCELFAKTLQNNLTY